MAKRTKKSSEIKSTTVKKTVTEAKKIPQRGEKKSNFFLATGLALLSLVIFILFIPTETNSLSKPFLSNFYILSVILSAVLFGVFSFFSEKSAKIISSSLFFSFVLFFLSRILLFPLGKYSFTEVTEILTFDLFRKFLIAPTAIFGTVSIWLHRSKLNILIEKDFNDFEVEKPKNSTILKTIILRLKAHKVASLLLLVVLLGVSATIFSYQLGKFDFWSDEKQVSQAAAGYFHTGKFQQWNFVKEKPFNSKEFDHNFPHLWLVAQSYKVFGISVWSSRIVSVLGGILFILLGYFVFTYFFRNRYIVLLFLASFALYPDEILLFRWTRMYGILVPYFLLQFTLAYKALATSGNFSFKNAKINSFFSKYLDFNYKYLLALIPFTILGYWVHKSTAFTLPALYLFILFLAITERRTRFYIATLGGILFVLIAFLFFHRYIPTHVMTWFSVNNTVYYDLLYAYPFTKELALVLLGLVFPVLLILKNIEIRKKLAYFYIMSLFVLVLFVFVIAYDISFRYVSFLVPISLMLIFYVLFQLARTFLGKYFSYALAFLILLTSAKLFNYRYDDLYVQNFASKSVPSVAYKEIRDNYKKGEAVFYQYPIHYYFKAIDTSAVFINMRYNRKYKFDTFMKDLKKYKSGWLEWDTQYSGEIDTLVYSYVNLNFKKIHGKAVDNTWTEVFRYDSTMVISPDSFKTAQYFPSANLKMNHPFTLSFWANMHPKAGGIPFLFKNYSQERQLLVSADSASGFVFKYPDQEIFKTGKITDAKWHNIIWQQGVNGRKFIALYLDGKLLKEEYLNNFLLKDFAKFKIGFNFTGQLNELRLYDKALNIEQIQAIYNNGSMTHISKLPANGYYFEPMNFWTKQ